MENTVDFSSGPGPGRMLDAKKKALRLAPVAFRLVAGCRLPDDLIYNDHTHTCKNKKTNRTMSGIRTTRTHKTKDAPAVRSITYPPYASNWPEKHKQLLHKIIEDAKN